MTGPQKIKNTNRLVSSQTIWTNVDRLGQKHGLTNAQLAELLLLSEKNFLSMKERGKDLSALSVANLARGLGLSFESVVLGDQGTLNDLR